MDWAQILVIVLAVLFAIFLVVAIVLAVMILKVTRQIRSATTSAEKTIQAIEGSVRTFNKTTLPFIAAKGIISQLKKDKKKGKSGEGE